MMRCGSCTVAQLVAVLGVTGLGVGGYTYFSGNCSSCTEATNAALVSDEECSACCSGESKEAMLAAQTTEGKSCCHGETQAAAVSAVAQTEEASGCCTGEAKTACKEGTEGCTGDGKDGCCGGCKEKAEAGEAVASSGAPAGGGK